MRSRILFIGAITTFWLCLLIGMASAQEPSGLNFISELQDYRTIRNMLPAYLSRLVAERLEERERLIARITLPAEVANRRAEVRARILQSIGGDRKSTRLNSSH